MIEQSLMKACKTTGGLTGGRLRNQDAHKVYCGTLSHFSSVNDAMGSQLHISKRAPALVNHKDNSMKRMEEDGIIMKKLLEWFNENDPLSCERSPEQLISFSTGLYCNDGTINPDKAKDIGMVLQKSLDNENYSTKFQTKQRIKPLSHLKKTVRVNGTDVNFDPNTLFNRLLIISEREISKEESLKFELTSKPMSLFTEDYFMRKSEKAKFAKHLKSKGESAIVSKDVRSHTTVVDGGWLVHQLPWNKNETYGMYKFSQLNFYSVVI